MSFAFPVKCVGHAEVITPRNPSDEESQRNSYVNSNNFIYALRLLRLRSIRESCTRQHVGWLL